MFYYGTHCKQLYKYLRQKFTIEKLFLSFQIEDFETSIILFLLLSSSSFFPKLKKFNISPFMFNILFLQWIFLWYLSTSFVKKNVIQPPGEPREHHLGEGRQKSSSYTKFHKKKNYRKWRYAQKKKFKSNLQENLNWKLSNFLFLFWLQILNIEDVFNLICLFLLFFWIFNVKPIQFLGENQ